MFDIGWMELMVIGVVALIVVGPKDLPDMFRQIGRFTAKLRQMSMRNSAGPSRHNTIVALSNTVRTPPPSAKASTSRGQPVASRSST